MHPREADRPHFCGLLPRHHAHAGIAAVSVAVITGSAGLIGAETSRFFAAKGLDVVGIDNDLRRTFFGDEASTAWMRRRLEREVPRYRHLDTDIRDEEAMRNIFRQYGREISVVVHAAA